MSDGMTDVLRDQQRSMRIGDHLDLVLGHIEGDVTIRRVIESALRADSIRGGLMTGETDLERDVRGRMRRLKRGSKREWAKLLCTLERDDCLYRRAKALSPWPNRMLIHVEYGNGFGTTSSPDADAAICSAGMKTYDRDDYVVVAPVGDGKPEVIWVRGYHNVNRGRRRRGRGRGDRLVDE